MLLETDRLQLRPFSEEDVEALYSILGDPQVMEFSLNGACNLKETEEYLHRILAHYHEQGFGFWALTKKEDGALVGFAGPVVQTIDGVQEVEVGYRIASKEWGNGYAPEAVKKIIHYCLSELDLNHLIAIIDPKNTKSVRVAEKVGMHVWKSTTYHGFSVNIYRIEK